MIFNQSFFCRWTFSLSKRIINIKNSLREVTSRLVSLVVVIGWSTRVKQELHRGMMGSDATLNPVSSFTEIVSSSSALNLCTRRRQWRNRSSHVRTGTVSLSRQPVCATLPWHRSLEMRSSNLLSQISWWQNYKIQQEQRKQGFFLSLPACVRRTVGFNAESTSCSGEEVFSESVLQQRPRGSRLFIPVINAAARPCHCFEKGKAKQGSPACFCLHRCIFEYAQKPDPHTQRRRTNPHSNVLTSFRKHSILF